MADGTPQLPGAFSAAAVTTRPVLDFFTLHFTEKPVMPDGVTLIVEVTIEDGRTRPAGFVADLILSVDEWDRIWRALVNSTAAFVKQGIALERTHPAGRM